MVRRWWIWLGLCMRKGRDGEHGVRFEVDGFGERWTLVGRKRQKGKHDLEIGGGLEGARVDYLELQGRPGLREGAVVGTNLHSH